MSTKPIPGHISVALAAVYIVAKIAELQFNEDKFKSLAEVWNAYMAKSSPHGEDTRLKNWATWTNETDYSKIYYNRKIALCASAHISLSRPTKDETFSTAYREDKVVLTYYDKDLMNKSEKEKSKSTRYASFKPPYIKMLDKNSAAIHDINNHYDFRFPQRMGLAVDFLVDRLKTGKSKSFLRTTDGRVICVPQEYWLTDQSEDVLSYDVHTQVNHQSGSDFGRLSMILDDVDNIAYQFEDGDNLNNPNHIYAFYPHHYSNGPNNSPEPVVALPNNKGGRPPVYDETAFARIVLKILWHKGKTNTKAELSKLASDQYEAEKLKGGRPSPEYARKRIAALWDDLDLGDEA